MAMTLLRRGQLIPIPPVEKALAFLEREGKGAPNTAGWCSARRRPCAPGCRAGRGLRRGGGHRRRHHLRPRGPAAVYELIAEAFGLLGAASPPAA
jgi:hypothetical protein